MADIRERVASLSPDQLQLLVEKLGAVTATTETEPIQPRAVGQNEAPLSFSQERLWFLDQLLPGSTAYNIVAGMRLKGELNEGALQGAFATFRERHEILRTRIRARNGEGYQIIDNAGDW
jgi:hypothetical protein